MVDFNKLNKEAEKAVETVKEVFPGAEAEQWSEIQGEALPELGEFFKFEEVGESMAGTLAGKRVLPARPPDFKKPQTVYDIRGPAGDLWTLNGNFSLDSKLKKVAIGTRIRVTYADNIHMGDGLSPMKEYRVEVSSASPVKSAAKRPSGLSK